MYSLMQKKQKVAFDSAVITDNFVKKFSQSGYPYSRHVAYQLKFAPLRPTNMCR